MMINLHEIFTIVIHPIVILLVLVLDDDKRTACALDAHIRPVLV